MKASLRVAGGNSGLASDFGADNLVFLIVRRKHTWSLTLREEHRLRVFENWVLRRIFGPKRDE
jgi:hypothetical protein